MKFNLPISSYFPFNDIINNNYEELPLEYQAMFSCDLTNYLDNNNFILCTYFSGNKKSEVSVFDSELYLKKKTELDDTPEEWLNNDPFIKILYFKDNSKFILACRRGDLNMRFRYFEYNKDSNLIVDKLRNVIGISESYLDIEFTQTHGHYGSNDIIMLDSVTIIKVFGGWTNYLIITIIRFYDNDTSMSIKIYNTFISDGYQSIERTRLAKTLDSFIVCLSARKNDFQRPGFFVMNFPNAKNVTLENTNIALADLIYLENKLFSLKMKLKVLFIPSGFIFYSKLKATVVEINEEYDEEDIFILRQYKINQAPSKLLFQSIAKGPDLGYSYIKVFPENKIVNDQFEYKGRKGE